jgi:flagellar M-ring protein FliF
MNPLASLKATLAGLDPAKRAGMAIAALAVVALLAWVATRGSESMGLLYSGLDPGEAGRIGQRLDELKVPYQNRGDGTTILVPSSQVAHVRMDLAASGLPRQGGSGYELLDTQSPMSMTSFMQRVQRLRAMEGELARTIMTLDGVKSARVHIVLPERESFARDTPKPTASVAVSMAGGMRLAGRQAIAIRLLIAGAVPGLRQEDVSVLDPSGVVLAADGGQDVLVTGHLAEIKAGREQALQQAVTQLLEPLVGTGRIKTVVSADIDTSREVSREEKFDPMSQVERSRHTQTDKESSEEAQPREGVSVAQNIPTQPPTAESSAKNASSNVRNGETVNYELSSVRSELVREPGDLKRLTVAVVVDGTTDANGTFKPRPKEELDRIAELVRSAVGFDAKRGDKLTVDSMQFIAPAIGSGELGETAPAEQSWLMPGAAFAGVLVLGGAAFLFFRRRQTQAADALTLALNDAGQTAMGGAIAGPGGQGAIAGSGESEQLLLADEQNAAATGAVATLNNIFDSQPDEALALVRAWIAEGSPA